MSQLPPSPPSDPSQPLGGPGWGVRESPRPFAQWEAERLLPLGDAPVASSALVHSVPPPPPPPLARSRSSRTMVVAGVAIFALAAVAVVVVGRQTAPSPSTTLTAGSGGSAEAVDPALATSTPLATPTPIPASDPRLVAQAGQEYLAAVGPLNIATRNINNALQAAAGQSCTCPAGQFDATPALRQIPGVLNYYRALIATLAHIRTELPALKSDIDAVAADTQDEMAGFDSAYTASFRNDPAGATGGFLEVHAVQVRSTPHTTRLRADLKLPPPPA